MSFVVYNSYTRRKEPFEPLEPGKALVYNCGPTVYARQHIGNFRSFLFADVLVRWLEYKGLEVRQVMNITDVGHLLDDADEGEDKLEAQAQKEKLSPWEIAERCTQDFLDDIRTLHVREPEVRPRATEHIDQMLAMIEDLIAKGHAYQVNGDVYFSVESFPRYGQLSGNRVEDLEAGARIEVRDEKRHPADFALWKHDEKHLMKWTSRFGEHGFPGWHIECSAMAKEHLGEQIDIHTGGEDNVFPHHECEIAQTECHTGKPFARYWMHAKFLQVDGGKMAKSLGNTYTLDDVAAKGFSTKDLRYALIRGHYRTPLNFTWQILEESASARRSLSDLMARLRKAAGDAEPNDTAPALVAARTKFESGLDDDLNMPEALAALFELRRAVLQGELDAAGSAAALAFLSKADTVLGVLDTEDGGLDSDEEAGIEALIEARNQARANKDWAESDRIRDELLEQGIVLEDGAGGTEWRKA